MSQLTPAFKLTLLFSIGLHLAAFLQAGGSSAGFHQANVSSTLNISLKPVTRSRPNQQKSENGELKTQNRPTQKVAQNKPVQKHPETKKLALTEQPASPETQSGQIRQVAGETRTGAVNEDAYRKQLLRHLEQYKHYPFIARRRQLEGQTSIRIAITDDGRLRDIECLAGNDLFCQAAIQAAREAQPFPTPPASLSNREFQYAMEYRLRN